MNGKGTFYLTNGNNYTAEYVDNHPVGDIEFHYTNGNVYIGQWKNNKKHG